LLFIKNINYGIFEITEKTSRISHEVRTKKSLDGPQRNQRNRSC
jgi:nucleoid DNA-binding protein